jgi:hypothetical protein
MPTLAEARTALAAAVSSGGLVCLPYPEETVIPPLAWVDSISVDFAGDSPGAAHYFCAPGFATATIISVAQRNDRPGAVAYLENFVAPVLDKLQAVAGVRLAGAVSGQANVGGQDLPAVFYTVQFVT